MSGRSELNAIFRKAAACPHGWHPLPGADSNGHIVWTNKAGARVRVSMSPSDRNSPRNIATRFETACGCTFWNRGGVGRGRKPAQLTGLDQRAVLAEADERADLDTQHANLMTQLEHTDPRRNPARAAQLATQIIALEKHAAWKGLQYHH